jgi:hypothetical protein
MYEGQPFWDCNTYCTFGLSDIRLATSGTANSLQLEYLICANSTYDPDIIAALLLAVAEYTNAHKHTPGVHGVLCGSGPVLHGGSLLFEHFYLAQPGYFQPEFRSTKKSADQEVELVQLIPVTEKEKSLIQSVGWEVFEELLIEQEIDVVAFDSRAEILCQGTPKH